MYLLSVIAVTDICRQVSSTKHNLLFVIWLMLTPSAFAVDTITLHLGRVSGSGWSAESLDLELNWQQGAAASYQVRAKEIIHPALSSPLKDLMITCQQGSISDHNIACQKGKLHLQHPILDDPQIAVSFEWNRRQQKLDIQLSELHLHLDCWR